MMIFRNNGFLVLEYDFVMNEIGEFYLLQIRPMKIFDNLKNPHEF